MMESTILIIAAFIGGLAALATPCVFPMIPITVSYFTKEGEKEGEKKGETKSRTQSRASGGKCSFIA